MSIPAPVGPFPPNNDLVGIAWLRQRVDGLDAGQVATSLPRDPSSWRAAGFLTISTLGRSPDIDIPVRHPAYRLDAWAAPADGSTKPPWNLANYLIELVRLATESDAALYGKPVALPPAYTGARVQSAYLLDEPQRIEGDPSGYARFTALLAIDWVRS